MLEKTRSRGKRKPNLKEDPPHLRFIRSLPSLVSMRGPCVAAHVTINHTDHGTGTKASDKFTVPLTWDEHEFEEHRIGPRRYWDDLGIDPKSVAEELYAVTGDYKAALRVIVLARGKAGLI